MNARDRGRAATRPRRRVTLARLLPLALAAVVPVTVAALALASPADEALRRGDWAAAIPLIRTEEARAPQNAAVMRKHGIALLGQGDASGAVGKLRAARERAPRDRATLYFLGRAAEAAGDEALALDAYRGLLALGGGRLTPIRARVDSLARLRAREMARAAIASERRLRIDSIPANSITVPDFAVAAGDSLAPLSRGLATVMITDLSKVPQLRVVERARLGVLLDELALASSGPSARGVAGAGAVAPNTAPRIGKLLGARRFAQGSLVPVGRSDVQLGASLIEVADGTVKAAGEPVAGPLSHVLELERTLLYQVLDTLRVPVDDALKRRIGPPPTRSFAAFVAFSRGLDLEARGLTDDARREFANALRLDPDFQLARDRSDALAADPGAGAALQSAMLTLATAPAGTDDRLLRGAAMAGFDGADVGDDRGTPANSRLSPAQRVGFRSIPITVRFP